MPSLISGNNKVFAVLAFYGAGMFIAGFTLQAFAPTFLFTDLGIALLPSGGFLMMHGTILSTWGKWTHERFPGKYAGFYIAAMCLGLVLSAIPVFYPSSYLLFELPGPIVFAYGFIMFMMQIKKKYGTANLQLVFLSLILLAAGTLIPVYLNLFQNSPFISLAIIPAITGVFLLYIPMFGKSFRYWQRQGYFQ